MLDIRQMKYLEAVYKYKSFTKASEALYVSQPAISSTITSIEKDYGVKLITRTTKDISFTAEGEALMARVVDILSRCKDAEDMMKSYSTSFDNKIRLGVSPTLSTRLLPYLYKSFFPSYPEANLYVEESTPVEQIQKLSSDILDVSFNGILEDASNKDFNVFPVIETEIYAIINKNNPLASKEKVTIRDLANQSLCLLNEKSLIRKKVISAFQKHAISPKIVSTHEQITCMFSMVKYGNCISFINNTFDLDYFINNYDIVTRPLYEPIVASGGFIIKANKIQPRIVTELIRFSISTKNIWHSQ